MDRTIEERRREGEEKLSEEYRDEQERLKERRLQLEGELRMKKWIVEVSRSDEEEGFAFLEPDLGHVWQSVSDELSKEFHSAQRTRERDDQIARCFSDEIRPPGDGGENWRENLVEEIKRRICEEIIDLAING